jgi:energy-coupling factor transport system permease protein
MREATADAPAARSPRQRTARPLHPLAWWIWALGLAVAASRTTNPLSLCLIIAVACVVVAARRTDAPWARAFRGYLILGAVIVVIRVVAYMVLGNRVGTTVVLRLPEVDLPDWAAGIRLGGPVTLEGVLSAATDGLRLATMIISLGAANTLANPKRLLRCVPAALHEVGTAVVVSLSMAPQLAESVQRVRRARQLRAGTERGHRAVRAVAVPVLADALDRSLALAAAMDSRGYGRIGDTSPARRRLTGALLILGLIGVCIGVYGVLDGTTSAAQGLPVLAAGAALAVAGIATARRRVRPTAYRPDPWAWPEWLVSASGVAVAATLVASSRLDPDRVVPMFDPLAWPTLPALSTIGILVGLLPAVVAPPVPDRSAAGGAVGSGGTRPPASELRLAAAPVAGSHPGTAGSELVP